MTRNQLTFALTSVACVAAGFLGHLALATVPNTTPLTFTGRLTNPDGTTETGQRNIVLNVYDSGGFSQCQTDSGLVDVTNGFFKVVLTPQCISALTSYSEPSVGISVNGVSIGRTKVGAVPFAMQAKSAEATDSVNLFDAADGTPQTRRLINGTFTLSNAGAVQPLAGTETPWGYGILVPTDTILAVKAVSGLKNGCEVETRVTQIHVDHSPRIFVRLSGHGDGNCGDVNDVQFTYVYLH